MELDRYPERPHRELTEEFRLLIRSSYWDYVEQDSRKRILSLFKKSQGLYQKTQ
jgi:hypothetical protein